MTSSVPLLLARKRARQISNVRYHLDLQIEAHARVVRGRSVVEFDLQHDRPPSAIELDWRPQCSTAAIAKALRSLTVNGAAPNARPVARGHLRVLARYLNPGSNRIEMTWTAPIGLSGSAITRYLDPTDGAEYIHTLFVPDEASSVFPCFDQPDLKAAFALTLQLPAHWNAIANAPLAEQHARDGQSRLLFAATEPISTYLFAFAAGPWIPIASADPADPTRLWVRRSQHRRALAHAPDILRLNREAVRYCVRYFAHPFPFAKYDLVAIPQFAYRGMEHAGATFLNEDAVLLPAGGGVHARFQRTQLIFHETVHQWMGDLVTMRWFDDLWLKEGFANFMAYKLASRVFGRDDAEAEFLALKASAYRTDQTRGALALHHPLSDLAAAKSVYGSIVYAKAPAVLRAAERMLGAPVFRRAARDFVHRHAYGAADWRDLVGAMERASGRTLAAWARRWILHPGVPRRRARSVAEIIGVGPDAYVVVQPESAAIDAIPARLVHARRITQRMQLWEALWQSVWDAKLRPQQYVGIALSALGAETHEVVVQDVLQHLVTVMETLLAPASQVMFAAAVERLLWTGIRTSSDSGTRRAWLEGYIALARTDRGLGQLQALLGHRRTVPYLDLTVRDRVRITSLLVVRGVMDRSETPERWTQDLAGRAGVELCFAAAQPNAATKRAVFERYFDDMTLPEEAIMASLGCFNHPAHSALTRPLLARALRALPDLVRTRKIFFVNRWLAAFIGGQYDEHALDIVLAFAGRKSLEPTLHLKLLESADQLERTVRIRAKHGVRS